MTVDLASRRALLAVARHAIAGAVNVPLAAAPTALPVFEERRGAFVTLVHAERLRGCVGRIDPDGPLRTLIPSMARSAALEDPRFRPVQSHELAGLRIEISLLGTPEALSDREAFVVGVHGLIVRAGWRRGLLLPQVAVQRGWDRETFLCEVCGKAGLAPDAWRDPATVVQSFTAEVFAEPRGEQGG